MSISIDSAKLAAALQEKMVALIKAERDRRRFDGGVKVGGNWFLSTTVATTEYNTLLQMSQGVPDTAVLRKAWRTMNGTTVDMTPAIVRQILAAGFATAAALDDAATAHIKAMAAAPDPMSYDYLSGGWPKIYGE